MSVKEFTSFDAAAIVRELRVEALNSVVSNVYQSDAKTLLLKQHKTGKPALWLVLEAGKRINLTAYAVEKPPMPSAFCMALRKYLRNSRLADIEHYEFERVVVLSFKAQHDSWRLILELFGEGNSILLDEDGKILQALTYRRMRDRNIVRGEPFKFAPSSGKNPLKMKLDEFQEGLRSYDEVEVVRAIIRLLSIGGLYAEEVLMRAGVTKSKTCDVLTDVEIQAIFGELTSLLSQVVNGALEPCVVLKGEDSYVDVVPVRLSRYQNQGFHIQSYGTFNEAVDEFYSRVSIIERATERAKTKELETEKARLGRIIAEQEKVVTGAGIEAECSKRTGDAIYAHFSELQAILDGFLERKRAGKEWKDIVSDVLKEKSEGAGVWRFFEAFDSRRSEVKVSVDNLAFSLDVRKTLFESAAEFYERSKRARQKAEGAQSALSESRRRLEQVELAVSEARAMEHVEPAEATKTLEKQKVKRKEWFEKFRWFVSSDGFLVVGGKDAVTNEVLIKKHTEIEDVVFHADIVGAPFVVIKTKGGAPSEQCLREAGEFAAAFSRAWREGFTSVDVYWVKPEQLSKGGRSGESVGHGAFVVRGERNWMRRVPLRMAIGVTVDENTGVARIGGGPLDAVKAKSKACVLIVPGSYSGIELLKHVLRSLADKVSGDLREAVSGMSVEAVRDFVPFAKGMIVED